MPLLGSSCGPVGLLVVASDTRGPQFESNVGKNFQMNLSIDLEKTLIMKKRPGLARLNTSWCFSLSLLDSNDCFGFV